MPQARVEFARGRAIAGRARSSGPLDRSPRTRLSTFSALIRHIGRPMPGTLDPPA